MDYNDDNDDNELITPATTFRINPKSINISSLSDNEDNNVNETNLYQNNTDNEELIKLQLYAKAIIVKAWKRYLDRKTFQILKNSLYEIKKLCTSEILRKLNPRESVLFNDPLSQGKAYHDAYKLMGNRNFEKVINKDNVWNNTCEISDPSDVTSKKEYIQYMNSMDKKPIYLGGRNNEWRELSTLSISIPLYEKEICNIYERNKNIYSSISLNNKIANRKVAARSNNRLNSKTNEGSKKQNNKKKNKRKVVKLMSEKKSNLRKQKERIKKMQQMYQLGKNVNKEENDDNKNENPETEEEFGIKQTEDSDNSSSYYSSVESSDSEIEEDINENVHFNIDDIENDDFHNIYEWANDLSFDNTFNNDFSYMKI
ncbi:hypothetical protein PIROE2DRAFT_11274 [Piromyces sp. E2]|nr:hypothetical protein PIROE2DRAFT_11274 [Piromyces sp. E2]|eukprot:OUM62424.1 hypothetical protein PIROE2DRAFT_11274 [Piromyces sp. E2]